MNNDNNVSRFEFLAVMVALMLLSVAVILIGVNNVRSNKDTQNKLDALASETDAIHSRIDAIEEQTEKHNAENGEIINTIIQNVNDIKTNVNDEIKRLDDEIKRVEESKQKKKEELEQAQAVYTAVSTSYEGGSGYDHPFRSQGTTNRDESGNLCIAARDLDKGTEVDTPFGKAVVYDYCPNGNLDIYTDW